MAWSRISPARRTWHVSKGARRLSGEVIACQPGRLVQAVTADQMPAEVAGQWREAAAALIEAAIPGDTDPPQTWLVCAALLPHAQAALADDSPGMDRLAHYLGARGSYAAAAELLQRVLDARERSLGPEHPDTLTTRNNLAAWTGRAGDPARTRDQFAALLPIRERVLGPEHPDTLATRSNLARWTGEAGDAAGARDQLAALLPVMERVLGAEHPDTLAERGNLARWTGEAGDPAGARDQFAALPRSAGVRGGCCKVQQQFAGRLRVLHHRGVSNTRQQLNAGAGNDAIGGSRRGAPPLVVGAEDHQHR
jgi:hypothetical protein